ncbi:MAG: pyridoxamine 5'-phosphate oxidase [Gemmatimonadetes bacterium]|nr:pyridoxamine 5'-phosphate oxidase [Gemmatimonadota bacterium]
MNLADLRQEYARASFSEADAHPDPLVQFATWFQEAQAADVREPNAMALGTTTPAGQPSVRIVLLKDVGPEGFAFYTDYRSRQAHELETTRQAALCFFWAELERQVRVVGHVARISSEESARYFRTRPLGSRIGAHASHQSAPLPSRDALEQRVREMTASLGDDPPLPEHWGGYRVAPHEIEFWQGRASRLHDRVQYLRDSHGAWTRHRLSP